MNDFTCRAIKGLDDKEKFIFENRILGNMTLNDAGQVLGVTGERIRQVELRVKTKLRDVCFKRHTVSGLTAGEKYLPRKGDISCGENSM